MALFFKKNWKLIAVGTVAVLVVVIGLLVFRVFNFINDVKGTRIGDAIVTADPQANANATVTAEARRCAASIDCLTPGLTPGLGPTPTVRAVTSSLPTPTPDISTSKVVQRIKNGERITVMYMGYGGPGHEGEYLTDTILILSFDPKTQTVTEFNIPRDLYVSVPGGPGGKTFKAKANGVFSSIMKWDKPTQDDLDPKYRWTDLKSQHNAAANLAANTFQNVLGVKIDYWFTMNFEAFRKLIDNMGGITVCVDRAFVDKEYPRNDNDQVDASVMTVSFDKGCQTMNGEKAIQFARSRKSKGLEEGDFARSRRQMKIIQSIKDEVQKRNLVTNAMGYMDALQGNLRVSLDLDEMLALANFFNSSQGKDIINNVKFDPEIMDGNNFLQDIDKGGSIGYALIPQAGEDHYTDIQNWAQRAFTFYAIRREQVRVQILNATGTPGKANNLADYLDDRGFRQAEPEAAPLFDQTTIFDYTEGKGAVNLEQLKKLLPNIKVVSKPADQKPYDNAPDLMLYLGKDYRGVAGGNGSTGGQGGEPPPTSKS